MALALDDRVKETSTTTGTGTLDLSGAVSGFQTFVAGIGDGNTTYYAIVNRDEAEWETGLGTVTDSSTDTLARTTVLASSNSDSAVDFSAGTKDVFATLPASKVSYLDASNDLILGTGAAGVDYSLKFDGETSDGVITWMEDEDSFKVEDDLVMDSTKKLYFNDEGGEYISGDATDLTVVSGGVLNIAAGGTTNQIKVTDGAIVPITDNDIDLGTASYEFKDAYFDGTVTSDAFAGPLTGNVTGNASGTAATVTTAAQTNITSLGTLTTLTVDNIIVNGTTIGHTSDTDLLTLADAAVTALGTITVGVDNTGHDVKYFGATAGSYWLWDESADGVVQIGTLTVGVNDAGHDVKFFGDTASAYMLWDTSTDDLVLAGAANLYLYDAGGGEKLSSDGTDLTINSGADINLTATSDVNLPNNVGMVFGDDGEKIEGDGTDLTIASSGVLNLAAGGTTNQVKVTDGAILPITDDDVDLGSASYQFKDAYIDGTLEADAITIGGTAVTAGGASKGFAIAVAIAL